MATLHAFDALSKTPSWNEHSLAVLYGDEPFLKRQMIEAIGRHCNVDGGFPPTVFDGETAQWSDVLDAVSTRSLFDEGGHRFVIVEQADTFVSEYRERLEAEVSRKGAVGCLVLVVSLWPSNTRLYKQVDRDALQIDCRLPLKKNGKSIDELRVRDWIVAWSKSQFSVKLTSDGASCLMDLTGNSLGLAHQELGKVSLLVKPTEALDPERIHKLVGGWSQKTVWEIIDYAVDGRTAEALAQLDHLLSSDEPAQAMFAQISYSLRRFALAAERLASNQRRGIREPFDRSLVAGGFREWPAGALAEAEKRMRRVGRERAALMHRWLLQADLALKGSHASPHRARIVLEQLFLRLAAPSTAGPTPAT